MTVYVSVMMDTIEESKERDETSQVEKGRTKNCSYEVKYDVATVLVLTSFSTESHVQKGWTSHRQLGAFNEPS